MNTYDGSRHHLLCCPRHMQGRSVVAAFVAVPVAAAVAAELAAAIAVAAGAAAADMGTAHNIPDHRDCSRRRTSRKGMHPCLYHHCHLGPYSRSGCSFRRRCHSLCPHLLRLHPCRRLVCLLLLDLSMCSLLHHDRCHRTCGKSSCVPLWTDTRIEDDLCRCTPGISEVPCPCLLLSFFLCRRRPSTLLLGSSGNSSCRRVLRRGTHQAFPCRHHRRQSLSSPTAA